ncbi:MAG: SpoIID/LytB domain-containing protein [Acidobacteria bacterium]|nr:SpoIID/LytB domain-containing protein [Acidobacteriota bacterium]
MSLPARLQDQALRRVARRTFALASAVVCAGVVVWAGLAPVPAQPATASAPTIRIGVTAADGSVRVETLPLEEYVARVVSGEGQPRAGAAAQQALAIVIRTFAAANRHRHRAEGYDLCDTTHCQVMRPVLPAAREAAQATAGQILLDRGAPAFVFYSAHNGGTPALASEVWPGATDYAPGEPEDACHDEPGWSRAIASADLERALRAAGLTGRLRTLSIVDRTASGRAGRLRVDGFTPNTITAHEFRMAVGRTLGWQLVRSTAFDVTKDGAVYRFDGVGYGHGVGLCVVGAGRRASRGETAATILKAYFRDLVVSPGAAATLTRALPSGGPVIAAPPGAPPAPPAVSPPVAPAALAATDIRLTMPAFEEHDRALVLGLVRQTRDDVAARALVKAPDVLSVSVHPTMDAFGHATGQPWWVTAATVGTAIDLAPISRLRQRGVLESTLRYEVAWAVITPHLTKAPAWVKVGAAMMYAGPVTAAPAVEGRVRCPSDAELLRPVSGGAQREAFLRAERCVRREIARGTRLTEIR